MAELESRPCVLLWPGEDAIPASSLPEHFGPTAGDVLAVAIDGAPFARRRPPSRRPEPVTLGLTP